MNIISLISRKKRAETFLQNWIVFGNLYFKGSDHQFCDEFDTVLSWLNKHSYTIEKDLNHFGVINYKRPFSNQFIGNYCVISNTLLSLPDTTNFGNPEIGYGIKIGKNILERYVGFLDSQKFLSVINIFNPIAWFLSFIGFILNIPIYVLKNVGLISSQITHKIMVNKFFIFLKLLAQIVMLCSSVWYILMEWDNVFSFLRHYFNNL